MPEEGELWVPERRARLAGGELDLTALRAGDRERVRLYVRSSRAEQPAGRAAGGDVRCALYATRSDPDWNYRPVDTLEQMTRNARAIVSGTVDAVEEGFFAGSPSSLLYLSQTQVLKKTDEFDLSGPAIVYPEAKIVIGDIAFCARDPLFPKRPKVGDRILIYQQLPARDLEGNLLEPFAHGLFVQSRSGDLFIPAQLRNQGSGYSSLDQVIESSQRYLGQMMREDEESLN